MLKTPENKLVELSMEETFRLMRSIHDIRLTSLHEPFREYVINIYENYEFSYNEMKDLIHDIIIGSPDETGMKILEEFTLTHNKHSNINKYIENPRTLSDRILEDIVDEKIPYDNTKDGNVFDFAKKLAKQELRKCKVLQYSNKEMKELFGVTTQISKDVDTGSKLNKVFVETISKATGGESEFSSDIGNLIANSTVDILGKVMDGAVSEAASKGTPFGDMLSVYKTAYEDGTGEQKDKFMKEVVGPLMVKFLSEDSQIVDTIRAYAEEYDRVSPPEREELASELVGQLMDSFAKRYGIPLS